MGPTVIDGLPAHILLVHVVVVLVPLTAAALVGSMAWPRLGTRLGPLLPLLALVTLVSVPLTTHSGEWLEGQVGSDPLVRRHAELGDGMLPWTVGLFLVAAAVWWIGRGASPRVGGDAPAAGRTAYGVVRMVATALTLVVAVGAVVTVYRIGDSGAKAAWHDSISSATAPGKG
jgi:hypothetical protein